MMPAINFNNLFQRPNENLGGHAREYISNMSSTSDQDRPAMKLLTNGTESEVQSGDIKVSLDGNGTHKIPFDHKENRLRTDNEMQHLKENVSNKSSVDSHLNINGTSPFNGSHNIEENDIAQGNRKQLNNRKYISSGDDKISEEIIEANTVQSKKGHIPFGKQEILNIEEIGPQKTDKRTFNNMSHNTSANIQNNMPFQEKESARSSNPADKNSNRSQNLVLQELNLIGNDSSNQISIATTESQRILQDSKHQNQERYLYFKLKFYSQI
jgi:hypothetical protein